MRKLLHWALGKSVDQNIWFLCVEIFWAAIFASAYSFNSAYAIRLGATNSQISLLTSIPALFAALVMLPAGRFIQSRERRKPWLVGSLLTFRAGILLIILVPWLSLGRLSQGTLVIAFLITWTLFAHFFNVGFIPFLSETIMEEDRADVFAARNIISGILLTFCNLMFGFWLIRVAFPANYQIMYLIGFATSLLSVYYLNKVNPPTRRSLPPVPGQPLPTKIEDVSRSTNPPLKVPVHRSISLKGQWLTLVSIFHNQPGFTQIIINTLLYGAGLWLASPLYILYFLRTLGASEAWIGVLGSVASLTTIIGYALWRWVIARWGEPKTLQRTIVTMGIYPLMVGLFPSLTLILFAAGLNGLIAPGVNLSHMNTLLKVIPEEKRVEYTAIYLTLTNIGAFICPIIGVALAGWFGFVPTLIGCGLLSIIGSTSFLIWPVRVRAFT